GGVQVGHLRLGDLTDLVCGDGADLLRVRCARALGHACRLLDQLGRRRGLGDEGERTVFVHRDLDRDHVAALGFCGGVVGLAELHDVHAVLTSAGPMGGAGLAAPAWIWSLISPATFFFFGGIVFLILRLDFGAALYTRWADFSCAPVPLPWPRGRTCGDTGATLESLRATGVQS